MYKHIPGRENEADIFTKNVDAGTLHRHSTKLCGDDGLLDSLKAHNLEAREGVTRFIAVGASTILGIT